MAVSLLEFIVGLAIVAATLHDVFVTVVSPGASTGLLQLARRVRRSTLPLLRRRRGRSHRPGRGYGPFLLIASFVLWMLLLHLGFGLMAHAVAPDFEGEPMTFPEALYLMGSSLVTIGLSGVDAEGAARWLVLAAGICGLGVITMTITYLLTIQQMLHQRETRLLALSVEAGQPPSGADLLETYGRMNAPEGLAELFRDWRDWSAELLHSHTAHPALAFYRTTDAGPNWADALEAVLDAATVTMALVDAEAEVVAAATLAHRMGSRAAAHLCALFDFRTAPDDDGSWSSETAARLRERLEEAGFAVRQGSQTGDRLAALRQDYLPHTTLLRAHFGAA